MSRSDFAATTGAVTAGAGATVVVVDTAGVVVVVVTVLVVVFVVRVDTTCVSGSVSHAANAINATASHKLVIFMFQVPVLLFMFK
jgi:hypothetical protein